ncbi:MAG: hypothetical protein ABW133_08930 [Polyangiaceae bacterium]
MRISRAGWGLGLVGTVFFTAGCPANTCFLTVNGRCSWSTCPDGAEFDNAKRTCVCAPNHFALGGSCLTLEAATRYCGKGAHFEAGGCAANRCSPGFEIDQETGACISPQQATQVATNMGIPIGQNQKLGCPPGEQLVVEGQQASCVPMQQTCGRDEVWDGRGCRKGALCPPGSGFDPATQTCIKFATGTDSKSTPYTVDLATWMRTSYGASGGAGAPSFCSSFNKHPLAFGVPAGATVRARITVQVDAPDGQVSAARAMTLTVNDANGQPLPAKGATEVQQAAEATLASLVAGGGKANAPSNVVTVVCPVVNSSKPTGVTVTGGA